MFSKFLAAATLLFCLVASSLVVPHQAGAGSSPHPLAGSTRYVGPSSTYATIQAAVDAASSGDTIIVANGTYYESVNIATSNLVMKGNSSDSCRIVYNYDGTDWDTDYAACVNVTASYVTVTGFTLEAEGKYTYGLRFNTISASHGCGSDNSIISSGDFGGGVMLFYPNYCSVRNNIISTTGSNSNCVRMFWSDWNAVENNMLYTSKDFSDDVYATWSWNNTISNNTCEGTAYCGYGVFLITSQDVLVHNNTMTMNGSYSVGVRITGTVTYGIRVLENVITLNGDNGYGIDLDGGVNHVNVSYNNVTTTGFSTPGIGLFNDIDTVTVFSNNVTTTDQYGYGIHLYNTGNPNRVVDNNITTEYYSAEGIKAEGSDFSSITGNDIKTLESGSDGIELDDSSYCTVESNDIATEGTFSNGLHLYQTSTQNAISKVSIICSGANDVGIYLGIGSDNDPISKCNVSALGLASKGLVADSSWTQVLDSTLTATTDDVSALSSGRADLLNCTFSTVGIDSSSDIIVHNYLNILVLENNGSTPMFGADVAVTDNGAPVYASIGYGGSDPFTNAAGKTVRLTVQDRWYDGSTTPTQNVTAVKVKKTEDLSWEEVRSDVDMSKSHSEKFVSTDITLPAPPSAVSIAREGAMNALNISWTIPAGVRNCTVYTNATGTWSVLDNVTTPKNWTVHIGLADERRYYYKMRSWRPSGNPSGLSAVIDFYLIDITPPAIPTGLAAAPIPGKDGINVTWSANTDDTKNYELWWKAQASTDWTKAGNISQPITSYELFDPALVNGTVYEFRLRAFDKVDLSSAFCPPVSVTHSDFISPAAPQNLTASTLSMASIRLDWRPSDPDIIGYLVCINGSEAGFTDQQVPYDITTGMEYTFVNLTPNTAYSFVVRAFDEANNTGPDSNTATNTTLQRPEIPRIIQTVPANGSVGVDVEQDIAMVFNVPMNTDSVASVLSIGPIEDYVLNWSVGDTIMQISFSSSLKYNTSYTVAIGKAASAEGAFMAKYPFVMTFRTTALNASGAKSLSITSPLEGAKFNTQTNITVSGISTGLSVGTEVTVKIVTQIMKCYTSASGAWSVSIKTPATNGSIPLTASAQGCYDAVNITIETTAVDDDDITTDDDSTGNNYAFFAIIAIIALLLMVIIIIVIVILLRKKKAAVAQDAPTLASKPTPSPEMTPVQGQPEEPEAPLVTISSPDAIEPEVESKDIFREKDKEAGRKEVQGAARATPLVGSDQAFSRPAQRDNEDLGSWPVPPGGDLVPYSNKYPSPDVSTTNLVEDPFNKDLPHRSDMILALPPAQVFESEFQDMPKIDEMFIISQGGLLLRHFTYKDTTVVDKDILASMLTVIQNFITDSFGKADTSLKTMGFGKFNILIVPGSAISAVVISSASDLETLEAPLKGLVQSIESKNPQIFKDWNGDTGGLMGIDEAVGGLLGK